MLKKEIKYTDFNGDDTSDVLYFHLSKPELVEMEFENKESFSKFLERIVEEKDNNELIKIFKMFVLKAYGQKSPDGKSFIKSEALSSAFTQTAAYEALYMEMLTDENAAAVFLTGILPKDIQGDQDKPTGPPVASVPPPLAP